MTLLIDSASATLRGNDMRNHVHGQVPERGTVRASPPQQSIQVYPPEQLPLHHTQQQQQQQQQQQHQHYHFTSSSSSASLPLSPPKEELSVQNMTPFPDSLVFSYTFYLGMSLILWILYLLLPRGFRQRYCGAHRKRYAQRGKTQMPSSGYWLPASQSMSDAGGAPNYRTPNYSDMNRPVVSVTSTGSSLDGARIAHTFSSQSQQQQQQQQPPPLGSASSSSRHTNSIHNSRSPPSPDHPALKKIPPNSIIAETMARLQGRGIRLVAHGVHSDAKRVWIKLDDESHCVTWQTEFPRRVPNQAGQVSIVLMRGSVHRIALTNILYIDVGKKTNALKRLDDIKVPDPTCFSLLTQNGSLDLQASSKLERDALVSCFSMILDDVHANENWRELYEASPDHRPLLGK